MSKNSKRSLSDCEYCRKGYPHMHFYLKYDGYTKKGILKLVMDKICCSDIRLVRKDIENAKGFVRWLR